MHPVTGRSVELMTAGVASDIETANYSELMHERINADVSRGNAIHQCNTYAAQLLLLYDIPTVCRRKFINAAGKNIPNRHF